MTTLHALYKEGSEERRAAIQAFGERHFVAAASGQAVEPDWDRAEKHFTALIAIIMGESKPVSQRAFDHVR
ncbi:hypothetical protein [Streptomyces sp. NPDC059916]|uniref:hypothetical protein n=1 Tax=Streptomyces sp. NPDC059916 TaxID=3347001 RepID=UPI0036804291